MKKDWILLGALALGGCAQEKPVETASKDKSPVPAKTSLRTPRVVQRKKESFKVFKIWSNDVGSKFRIILIPSSHVKKHDMVALGQELKDEDDERGEYLFTFVYDNAKAAGMDGKSYPGQLTDKDVDFQMKHKVGEFGKNPSTGYRAFRIYFDGFLGVERQEIIYNNASS